MSDERTPILYIAPWVDLGGSDRGTIDWFKNIDRTRWAPSLITTTPSPNRWLRHVEPYAEEIWNLPDLMPGAAFPEFILGFIENRGVRLVHLMNSRLGYDLLPDMTCLPEPPAAVVQLHAEEPNQTGYVRYVSRRYGNLIDAFSVVSENLKQTIVDYEIPPSRIEVIYLGVDSEGEFDPRAVEAPELPANGAKRILWPGRLVEQKDPMLTMEVLARARERGAEFVLDVVGDGHLKEPAQERANELGIADAIEWHPPSQEMARWYRSSDLLLMTSVYEGIPLVIYEALAMGLPVVAPALPGNVEFMDADSGILVEPRDDVDRYADAIVGLLGDEERRRAMGERSRKRMVEEFSLAEMGSRHDALYERLLSERPASSRWRNEELFGEENPVWQVPESAPPQLRLERDRTPERTIGVIIPCYRHGIFLDACIGSVKNQTLRPDAIVVVDDGSDDAETVEALARLDEDPDVTVLRQPENRGPSAARNRALAQLNTDYFLPIDADDELLPDALERMLERLERAPSDVGFVYPNAQHIGNQDNYVASPAYNLWLLMEQNYCPAPALFDRRLFEEGTGVSYPEEIVVGHEDWDLVLQLAERGIHGLPIDGPTFLYRKQGFSRVHAVDYGPESFDKTIQGRHTHLYGNRDAIKAKWAPALSVVLLDDDDSAWGAGDLGALDRQTCPDFEVLAGRNFADSVRAVGDASETPGVWLQTAIDAARGRWVLLLPRSVAGLLDSVAFIEQLIHAFAANDATAAVVLAEAPDISRVAFSQLDDRERLSASPVAVAFERPLWGRVPEFRLGVEESLLADLVVGLRIIGPVQWRVAPGEANGGPWRRHAEGPDRQALIDVNVPRPKDAAVATMRHMVAHQRPRLPEMTRDRVRRWKEDEAWVPPQARLLCRHLDLKTGFRTITPERNQLSGHHRFERVLGCTHIFAAPGTSRLVHANHSFELTDDQGPLADGHFDMGYVEQQPLPMLEGLELRRVPDTGQEILVAGADDPLIYNSEQIAFLGWIEAYPILPRADDILHTGPWAVVSLRRQVDPRTWRHRYRIERPTVEGEGAQLGSLHRHSGPGAVALRLRSDGRLVSELCTPGRASRDPRKFGRWLTEPLRGGEGGNATASRLRHFAVNFKERRLAGDEGEVLGYLRRQLMPGCSTLYSTIHPVTGDQLVTRSPEEANAAGYVMDGILGAIFDPPDAAE